MAGSSRPTTRRNRPGGGASGILEHDQYRLVGVEGDAQLFFENPHDASLVGCRQHQVGQGVNTGGQHVIAARDVEQVLQLALELEVFLAEYEHLPLDQRHGRAASVMRQPKVVQQAGMALEEFGIGLEILGDGCLQ